MSFSDSKSGRIYLKSRHAARRMLVDDNVDLARGIADVIVRHPKKFFVFLVLEGWVHSLVVHHINEARDLMSVLNPF